VIVPAAEIERILTPRKLRRRVMRLPIIEREPPVEIGRVYRLQTRPGLKARLAITITHVGQGILDQLTLSEARDEGHSQREQALKAWADWFGQPTPEQPVWIVGFVKGDESAFYAPPIFLSRRARDGGMGSDVTTRADKAIVENGSAVELCVLPGAGEQARVMAMAQSQAPVRSTLQRQRQGMESLSVSMVSMKARNRARLIAKQFELLERELPVSSVVGSRQSSANGNRGKGVPATVRT
jgi:hypothetical protein